mmetsp:Transcript_43374/g.92874  ORF Transcript_43374/g.92874 Transcript_43374/m.92874 type:complete len:319 (+) Transcript_43374:859-1815(+)
MHALVVSHICCEASGLIDRLDHACSVLLDDTELHACAIIVLSEGRGLVDDAGTCAGGDVFVGDDMPHLVLVVSALLLEEREERFVANAHKCRPLDRVEELEIGFLVHLRAGANPRKSVLADNPLLPTALYLQDQVVKLRVDTESHVGGKGPRRRCPRKQPRVLLVGPLELHDDGRIGHFFVVELDLKIGEGGGQGSAVGHDSECPVDKAFVEEFLEAPPDGLHVGEIHGFVVVVEVDPSAKTLDDVAPLLSVLEHNSSALFVVLVDPHVEHVGAALDFEFGVDDALNRDTVAIPPEPSLHMVTSLVGESAHHILDGTS